VVSFDVDEVSDAVSSSLVGGSVDGFVIDAGPDIGAGTEPFVGDNTAKLVSETEMLELLSGSCVVVVVAAVAAAAAAATTATAFEVRGIAVFAFALVGIRTVWCPARLLSTLSMSVDGK